MALIDLLNKQQAITDGIAATGSAVTTARLTPVNAVAASVTILATEIAQMANDETITFGGETFTKKSSTTAADGEFADIAGLRDCVDELLPAWVTSGTTNATLTSATKGLAYNDLDAVVTFVEATTAGGDESTEATCTIAAAPLALLAAGDTVSFLTETFTKVASNPGATEFTNTAGLTALLAAIDGWTAVVSTADIVITADAVGAAGNGNAVTFALTRSTSGGVNGTVGLKDQLVADASYLYVCTAANSVNDANWRKISLGTVY